MGRDVLKTAVNDLEIDDVDRRSVQKMIGRLSRSRKATPEYLLEFLSEHDVKHVCERLSISAIGRRKALVSRLLAAAGRVPAPQRVAAGRPEPAGKASSSRRYSPQVDRMPPRGVGARPSNTIYTVGCNGISEPQEMAALLRENGVEVLVDVRWKPYARFKPQFNQKKLQEGQGPIKTAGVDYLHIVELGNVGKDSGVVRLKNEAKGLARLSDEMRRRVVAIMCQCKMPEQCHRSVVARKMSERLPGLRVEHLQAPSQA